MATKTKIILIGVVILIVTALAFAHFQLSKIAQVGASYQAKIACSEIFVAGRDRADVIAGEFNNIDPAMAFISVTVDEKSRKVVASAPLQIGRSVAVFRDGYGCTLRTGILTTPSLSMPRIEQTPTPRRTTSAIDAALRKIFADDDSGHRSLLIMKDGVILGDLYAEGFSAKTPFLSWSMAKSVTATLIGAAVLHGFVDINEPAPTQEWAPDDPRNAITWRNMLHMQSGLNFEEEYEKTSSDVNQMLFTAPDAGAVAAASPPEHAPGEFWYYSSGTTNLLMRNLRRALFENEVRLYDFAYGRIFQPLGASSFIMEPDASGTPIGSSFIYATAEDWARLGQLYLQDGVWEGQRLLPENWAEFVTSPASASDNQYGAHFWLNRAGDSGRPKFFKDLPADMYFMAGHEGQYVFIFPSENIIVIRTGMTRNQNAMDAIAPDITRLFEIAKVAG